MNLNEHYPTFGRCSPNDMSVGIALGMVATIFIALHIYIQLQINTFWISVLICALFSWVQDFSPHIISLNNIS